MAEERTTHCGGCVWIGGITGATLGIGATGFFWMNPYIALFIFLAGVAYVFTIRAAWPVQDSDEPRESG